MKSNKSLRNVKLIDGDTIVKDLRQAYDKRRREIKRQEKEYNRTIDYKRKVYDKNKKEGICVCCRKRKARKGKTRCTKCGNLHKKHKKKNNTKTKRFFNTV